MRRQPKAIPDQIALHVRPPGGWEFVSGTVQGGDAAIGVAGESPVLRIVDGAAELAGRITSNLVLELELRPS